jgi:hypothetical protein
LIQTLIDGTNENELDSLTYSPVMARFATIQTLIDENGLVSLAYSPVMVRFATIHGLD